MAPIEIRLRKYLSEPFLDFQFEKFFDSERGGFHEKLTFAGDPPASGPKRLLVQCRQLFVRSRAALLPQDIRRPIDDNTRAGFRHLLDHYRDATHGGWFFQTDCSGNASSDPGDPGSDKDLYGHAFVIFALSSYYEATQDAEAIAAVDATIAVIERRFRAPDGHGLIDRMTRDWQPRPGVRRQNPHMHLLEALLGYRAATGNAAGDGTINALITLARDRFIDAETGALREFFAEDWNPDPERGHIVEPGHHFEWAWLLDWAARELEDDSHCKLADSLFAWGCRHGVDRNCGGVHDEVDGAGDVVAAARRIWPQTEYIKALAAQSRRHGRADLEARLAAAGERLLGQYLLADGRWHEHLDATDQPTRPELPGTSGYHIFLALEEGARGRKSRP